MNLRALSLDRTPPEDYEPESILYFENATLTQIADHFGSDKGSIKHRYTRHYERELERFRGKPINLLELGVACGASLKMWSRYFMGASIVGVDIRPECKNLCRFYPHVRIEIGDATREVVAPGAYQVIVDDASHIAGHIVKAFNLHWPLLQPGGLYFVEDLRCTHNPNYSVPFPVDEADKDRGLLVALNDDLLRRCDNGGDVARVTFHRELMVVEKR